MTAIQRFKSRSGKTVPLARRHPPGWRSSLGYRKSDRGRGRCGRCRRGGRPARTSPLRWRRGIGNRPDPVRNATNRDDVVPPQSESPGFCRRFPAAGEPVDGAQRVERGVVPEASSDQSRPRPGPRREVRSEPPRQKRSAGIRLDDGGRIDFLGRRIGIGGGDGHRQPLASTGWQSGSVVTIITATASSAGAGTISSARAVRRSSGERLSQPFPDRLEGEVGRHCVGHLGRSDDNQPRSPGERPDSTSSSGR